jgi:hypothetical protein
MEDPKVQIEERLASATSSEELLGVAVDAQAAYSHGDITWPQSQSFVLRAVLKSFDTPETTGPEIEQ